LSGLGSQVTARQGNALGILGVGSGVLASLGAVGFSPEVITQFAAVAGVGALAGTIIGRRVTATELPQTVALLHSIVGLSAVLTSIGSVLQDTAHLSTLHSVTAYLGVVIGKKNSLFPRTLPTNIVARWNHIHRIHCCVPQARRKIVEQASHPSRQTSSKHHFIGGKCRDHGWFPINGAFHAISGGFFPWCKHNTQLFERLHDNCSYRRGRYAYDYFFKS
jgi:hypothetical protein